VGAGRRGGAGLRVKTRHLVFYGGGLGEAAAGDDLAADFEEAFGAEAGFLVEVGIGGFCGGDFLALLLFAGVEGEALLGEFEFLEVHEFAMGVVGDAVGGELVASGLEGGAMGR